MRKFGLLLLMALLLASPLAGTSAQAAPPICTPGDLGCIPTPQECATGLYNGYWKTEVPERFADCTGYLDPITKRGHVVNYVGGDLRGSGCGAVIANDRMKLGGWGDPNRCPPASAPAGYGVKGRAYQEPVSSSRGVVASFSGLASRAGVAVLDAGGNAVDAAIATVFAVGVARPESCGIGGGGFLVYRGADGQTAALDFRESAPAAFKNDTLAVDGINKQGTGHLVVGVPGTVAGMAAASARYGALPWADLLARATKLAQEGVPVTSEISDLMFANEARLNRFPETRKIYLKDGLAFPPTPISKPEDFVQSDYAESLRAIAKGGPDVFYKGFIAERIVTEMENSPTNVAGGRGVMTRDDLANYSAVWRTPLTGKYRDAQLVTMPPPTSGGIFTLEVLNLLEGFDLPKMKHSSADHLHLFAEAQKIAWADRNAYVADPGFVDVPTAELTSKQYANERRSEIKADQAGTYEAGSLGATAGSSSATGTQNTNTTHVSVIDAAGNAVAVTCTIEQPFGSAVVAPGTGFLLNNQLTDFDGPGTANEPAAGKRPRSSTSPTIVVLRGRPILVVGGVGGPAIPMGVTMTVSNMVDFAMGVARAVDAARLDERTCCTMLLEDSRVPATEIDVLKSRGHTIERAGEYHFQPTLTAAGVNRETGARLAVSDPRTNGEPAAQLPS